MTTVVNGVLYLDGRPRLLLAGDYPYYRDRPERWAGKLAAMRAAGLEVVTFYVPWRHHELDGRIVFTGPGNRDLAGFLRAIAAAGLLALAKPGPYVHAELPLGGLPDRVALGAPMVARSADGTPLTSHGQPLPSLADPGYRREVARWLGAVGEVLRPWRYPAGPLVAVQAGNEGGYGETALPVDGYDYADAPDGTPRVWHTPSTVDGLRTYVHWGRCISDALEEHVRGFADALGLGVPAFTNLSAPARAAGHDAWLVRGVPRGTHYGYTSWVGDPATDDAALVDHVLVAGRARGPNLEQNWSLDWVDGAWRPPGTPIFAGLLGLACGATGLTVYTACATSGWGDHLVTPEPGPWRRPPYGAAAPIAVDGAPGPALPALAVLTAFLGAQGSDLVTAAAEPGVRWYGARDLAALAAWAPPAGDRVEGHPLPLPAARTLVPFVRACLRLGIPFAPHPGPPAAADPTALSPLVVRSGLLLDARDQRWLADRIAAGDPVLLLGEPPAFDADLGACDVLERACAHGDVTVLPADRVDEDAIAGWLARHAAARPAGPERACLEFRRVPADGRGAFVFLFNRQPHARRVCTAVDGAELSVDLSGHGVAVLRVAGARLLAAYVKGIDEHGGRSVPVSVRYGADMLDSSRPCDLSLTRDGVRHTGTAANRVTHGSLTGA